MYTDIVPKISCQFLIGNVYLAKKSKKIVKRTFLCQFLIGNVSLIMAKKFIRRDLCQFLIGNVSLASAKKVILKAYDLDGVNSS